MRAIDTSPGYASQPASRIPRLSAGAGPTTAGSRRVPSAGSKSGLPSPVTPKEPAQRAQPKPDVANIETDKSTATLPMTTTSPLAQESIVAELTAGAKAPAPGKPTGIPRSTSNSSGGMPAIRLLRNRFLHSNTQTKSTAVTPSPRPLPIKTSPTTSGIPRANGAGFGFNRTPSQGNKSVKLDSSTNSPVQDDVPSLASIGTGRKSATPQSPTQARSPASPTSPRFKTGSQQDPSARPRRISSPRILSSSTEFETPIEEASETHDNFMATSRSPPLVRMSLDKARTSLDKSDRIGLGFPIRQTAPASREISGSSLVTPVTISAGRLGLEESPEISPGLRTHDASPEPEQAPIASQKALGSTNPSGQPLNGSPDVTSPGTRSVRSFVSSTSPPDPPERASSVPKAYRGSDGLARFSSIGSAANGHAQPPINKDDMAYRAHALQSRSLSRGSSQGTSRSTSPTAAAEPAKTHIEQTALAPPVATSLTTGRSAIDSILASDEGILGLRSVQSSSPHVVSREAQLAAEQETERVDSLRVPRQPSAQRHSPLEDLIASLGGRRVSAESDRSEASAKSSEEDVQARPSLVAPGKLVSRWSSSFTAQSERSSTHAPEVAVDTPGSQTEDDELSALPSDLGNSLANRNITPRTAKRWSLDEMEQSYQRMRAIITSTSVEPGETNKAAASGLARSVSAQTPPRHTTSPDATPTANRRASWASRPQTSSDSEEDVPQIGAYPKKMTPASARSLRHMRSSTAESFASFTTATSVSAPDNLDALATTPTTPRATVHTLPDERPRSASVNSLHSTSPYTRLPAMRPRGVRRSLAGTSDRSVSVQSNHAPLVERSDSAQTATDRELSDDHLAELSNTSRSASIERSSWFNDNTPGRAFAARPTRIASGSSTLADQSLANIRKQDKIELFLQYTKAMAELDALKMQSSLERQALLDALQEQREALQDIRNQRDALQARNQDERMRSVLGYDPAATLRNRSRQHSRSASASIEVDHSSPGNTSLRADSERSSREAELHEELQSTQSQLAQMQAQLDAARREMEALRIQASSPVPERSKTTKLAPSSKLPRKSITLAKTNGRHGHASDSSSVGDRERPGKISIKSSSVRTRLTR
ncbi:uncharacterized protein L969DRAFT_59558 [Mixia osmundae IAM 14324]|uniref:Uncharacterized protein n=1 Tax=Mixia osmundae (strain CBS 9802 / IAM 14324 / JCM 22182 / KY 12970) TaxID=764103 RepID=G7E5Q3_MIXOS|nr:uncharacterized protein L969DRAFT_59558 [Mixia osmundae IAM 14324]KEI40687.1 hypothetical protein L969DRAFT_59558 [Mixia osmundae IAM 14324]GAA98163.1 hypothetical protein E5Q_04846 [Mixia osmundae IAM 14324]